MGFVENHYSVKKRASYAIFITLLFFQRKKLAMRCLDTKKKLKDKKDTKISPSHVIRTVLIDQSERATPGAQPEQILLESRVNLAVTAAESSGRNRSNRHSFSLIKNLAL